MCRIHNSVNAKWLGNIVYFKHLISTKWFPQLFFWVPAKWYKQQVRVWYQQGGRQSRNKLCSFLTVLVTMRKESSIPFWEWRASLKAIKNVWPRAVVMAVPTCSHCSTTPNSIKRLGHCHKCLKKKKDKMQISNHNFIHNRTEKNIFLKFSGVHLQLQMDRVVGNLFKKLDDEMFTKCTSWGKISVTAAFTIRLKWTLFSLYINLMYLQITLNKTLTLETYCDKSIAPCDTFINASCFHSSLKLTLKALQ